MAPSPSEPGARDMAKKFPLHPAHPERTCWGCDKFCPAHAMQCGNGSERSQHPMELFGDDWAETGLDPLIKPAGDEASPAESAVTPAA